MAASLNPWKPLGLVLGLAYAAGSPVLDPIRPSMLEAPLRGFHADVTAVVVHGALKARALATGNSLDSVGNVVVSSAFFRTIRHEAKQISPR